MSRSEDILAVREKLGIRRKEFSDALCFTREQEKMLKEWEIGKLEIPDEIYDKILNIARKNKQYKFILFGSRARGKYKKESDIDIAIKGNIKTEDKYRIINEFDLINTIHKIDLVFIEELTKKELVENIDKEGVEIK